MTAARRLVTLTSDVGSAYAAQMKAVLARRVEPGRVLDLAHDLPAHSVAEAAFLLRAMAKGFPAGTVHVAVVDPGVGGRRVPIAIECRDGSVLVGPDNGVLMPLAQELGVRRAFRLVPPWGPAERRVGTTFDGRDVFAPAAGLLATGRRVATLGRPHAPMPFRLPRPLRLRGGAQGEVLHVDRFGNLVTNVPSEWLPAPVARVRVRVGTKPERYFPVVASYEALGRLRPGVLRSSFGLLELAVAEGRASDRWRARGGTPVALAWSRPRRRRMTVNSAGSRHR